jgi:hypothetical protein
MTFWIWIFRLKRISLFKNIKCLPLIILEFLDRICFESVLIRVKCVINWSRIKRVRSLCIKLDFEDVKSPHDELRINSSSLRWENEYTGDFCRDLLGDIKRWWVFCVGDGERATCLRDLFGLRRSYRNKIIYLSQRYFKLTC